MVTKTRRSSPAGVICPSKTLAYFLNECGYDDATIALFTKQNNTFALLFFIFASVTISSSIKEKLIKAPTELK